MPLNATIDDGFGNSGGGSPALPASWILVNPTQSVNWDEADGDPQFSAFQMKFNTMTNDYASYPSYKIKYFINKDYMNVSGTTVDSVAKEITINPDGTAKLFLPEFLTGNTILGGTHSIYITMRLYGENPSYDVFLDEKTHSITLNYTQQLSLIKLQKNVYNIVFVKSSGLLYGDKSIVISQNLSSEVCSISFNQTSEYFVATPGTSTSGFTISEGADVQDIENLPASYSISGKLLDSSLQIASNFIINITTLENDDIVVTPTELEFILIKSNADTKSANLQLINVAGDAYTIALPSYLTASSTSGSSSTDITITTVNGSTLLAGEYEEDIVISYDGKTLNVPVKVTVIEFITVEFLPNDYNFCLDEKLIKFYRQSAEGVFIKITLSALFKINGSYRTATIPMQAVYFEDRCDFDIGEVINNYFLKYRKSLFADCASGNFMAKVIYYPAEISMVAQELDESYNVLTTTDLADVKLYAGKKPLGFPFLTNNLIRSRVEGSKQLVSYISNLVDPEDIADNISFASALPDKTVASVMLCEDNGLIFWPQVKTISKDGKDLKIYTRKSGKTIINIQFENQNFAPEYISFSGDYDFYKDKVHTVDNNLRTALSAKFKTESVQTLNVDTGFILKAEIPVIDELADALFCIIEIEGKYYSGYCKSAKIVGVNSTSELINYSLEFVVVDYEN